MIESDLSYVRAYDYANVTVDYGITSVLYGVCPLYLVLLQGYQCANQGAQWV